LGLYFGWLAVIGRVSTDAFYEFAGGAVVRQDDLSGIAADGNRGAAVEAKACLMVFGTVALDAAFREDGLDVAHEVDGCRRFGDRECSDEAERQGSRKSMDDVGHDVWRVPRELLRIIPNTRVP